MGCARRVSILSLPPDHTFVIHTLMLPIVAPNRGDGVEKKKKKLTNDARASVGVGARAETC